MSHKAALEKALGRKALDGELEEFTSAVEKFAALGVEFSAVNFLRDKEPEWCIPIGREKLPTAQTLLSPWLTSVVYTPYRKFGTSRGPSVIQFRVGQVTRS